MALERQIEHMEAAKQTIKDFTADAEATVIRSIQAQREANLEVQRLRIEARLEQISDHAVLELPVGW